MLLSELRHDDSEEIMVSGMMLQGKWTTERNDQDQSGKFKEKPTTFRDRFADAGQRTRTN
ncbi:hypothetical protein VB735_15025 [Halotia wernerae UHCC 0503]|nr:hypothetical protein [Halotia wernerae UHCC 0503]